MQRILFALASAIALSPATSSQNVVAYGRIVAHGAGFALECPLVELVGPVGLLSPLAGRLARVTGTSTGSAQAPRVQVEAATESADVFQVSGSLRPGGDIRFRIESPTATAYYFLVSGSPGFLPLEGIAPGLSGTFFLDVDAFSIVASGLFSRAWEVRLPVPNVARLVGLQVFTQAAVAVPRGAIYLNSVCATLQ